MLKIKLFVLAVVISLVGFISSTSHQFSSKAESDTILGGIAAYRTWAKVTKEPLGFQIDGAAESG